MNDSVETVIAEVEKLYGKKNQTIDWNSWMWNDHVKVVARFAEEISTREGCNVEQCILAAYLHDIAFAWMRKDNPACDEESLKTARKILTQAGVAPKEVALIVDKIIAPHGMTGDIPTLKEALVLSTADAMAHFMTDFYLTLCRERYLFENASLEDYKAWVTAKIERDMHRKIHFEPERRLAKPQYEALKILFGNKRG